MPHTSGFPIYPSLTSRIAAIEFDDTRPAVLEQLEAFIAAFRAYRRECEGLQEFGERATWEGEDYFTTDKREAMFAAFDALERGAD